MKQILVIVPFPMSEENLAARRQQLKAVSLSPDLNFVFRSVKAAPAIMSVRLIWCLLIWVF